MEVGVYVGFWAYTVKCTRYGFCGQGGLQEYKGNFSPKSGGWATLFWVEFKKSFGGCMGDALCKLGRYPIMRNLSPKKLAGEGITSAIPNTTAMVHLHLHVRSSFPKT